MLEPLEDTCAPLTPFSLVHSAEANGISTHHHYFQPVHSTSAPGAEKQQNDSAAVLDANNLCPHPPIEKIPNEILSLIFELGYFNGVELDSCFRALIEIVSHRWREVSYQTPSIWSVYHISQGNVDIVNELTKFLERSRDHPLSISLTCFWDPAKTQDVLRPFLPHSKRWKSLSITTSGPDIFHYFHGISVPQLETLTIYHFSSRRYLHIDPTLFDGQLPSLRHLVLRNISFKDTTLPLKGLHSLDIRGYGTWPNRAELNNLIGGSSSLRKLVLHVRAEPVLQDIGHEEDPPIFLPALRTFIVITSQWLSPHIATLSHVFSCPSMDFFTLTDNSTPTTALPYNMVCYLRTGSIMHPNSPTLQVRSCDLYHAWRCLNTSRHITTLELDDIHWPHWSNVTTVLAALPYLENINIPNIDPTAALSDLGEPTYPFKIASLKKLEVGAIRRKRDVIESDLARFIGLFEVPGLQQLVLRNISAEQWKHILLTFTAKVEKYPVLESLSIVHLQGLPDSRPDPSLAFPHLRHLVLSRVTTNTILQCLVNPPSILSRVLPWPRLMGLSICDDPLASIPLLHRIVALRPPYLLLRLDGHFQRNAESWKWLKQCANVLALPMIDPGKFPKG